MHPASRPRILLLLLAVGAVIVGAGLFFVFAEGDVPDEGARPSGTARAAIATASETLAASAHPALAATGARADGHDDDPALVDASLPDYEAVGELSGNLTSEGSDTLHELVTQWAAGFKRHYPRVAIRIESKGSALATPALLAGRAQLGPMSREMKPAEIADFQAAFGYEPTAIQVAIDAVAICVHRDNPIAKLTVAQLDAIFGKQRRSGLPKDVATWGDVGLAGAWASRPIRLFGRNSASTYYGFLKTCVLKNGDFKESVQEQPGLASVVLGVSEDSSAIGYCSIGYRTLGVRAVPIAPDEESEPGTIGASSVYAGSYPLTRFLYVYVKKAPDQPLDPLVREFMTYALSRPGQLAVARTGFFPLPADVAGVERAKWSTIRK